MDIECGFVLLLFKEFEVSVDEMLHRSAEDTLEKAGELIEAMRIIGETKTTAIIAVCLDSL